MIIRPRSNKPRIGMRFLVRDNNTIYTIISEGYSKVAITKMGYYLEYESSTGYKGESWISKDGLIRYLNEGIYKIIR